MKTKIKKKYETMGHFEIWHDNSNSTFANHRHISFNANFLYDQVVFYTNSEYETL